MWVLISQSDINKKQKPMAPEVPFVPVTPIQASTFYKTKHFSLLAAPPNRTRELSRNAGCPLVLAHLTHSPTLLFLQG